MHQNHQQQIELYINHNAKRALTYKYVYALKSAKEIESRVLDRMIERDGETGEKPIVLHIQDTHLVTHTADNLFVCIYRYIHYIPIVLFALHFDLHSASCARHKHNQIVVSECKTHRSLKRSQYNYIPGRETTHTHWNKNG